MGFENTGREGLSKSAILWVNELLGDTGHYDALTLRYSLPWRWEGVCDLEVDAGLGTHHERDLSRWDMDFEAPSPEQPAECMGEVMLRTQKAALREAVLS